MRERNDTRLIEDEGVAFAMYCDECGLSFQEGQELAERLADELANSADDRLAYLPSESPDA